MKEIRQRSDLLRYWLSSLFFIPLLSVFGRKIQQYIESRLNPGWLAAAVFLLLSLVLAHFLKRKGREKKTRLPAMLLSALLLSGILAVYQGFLLPIEAAHLLVFSWFGWISTAVFGPLHGAAAVIAISVGDEILQYFLPDRVGDPLDMAINTVSGIVGVLLRGKG